MSTPSRPLGSLRDQGLGRDAGHRLRGRRGRHVGGRVRLRLGRVPQDAAESRVGRRLQRAPCAPTRPAPLSKSPPRGPAGANVTGWRYSRHASRSPARNGVYLGEADSPESVTSTKTPLWQSVTPRKTPLGKSVRRGRARFGGHNSAAPARPQAGADVTVCETRSRSNGRLTE